MSKFIYNFKGIARAFMPRAFFQASLSSKIARIFKDFDEATLESIAKRVNHYHKINSSFSLPMPNLLASQTSKGEQWKKPRLSLQTPSVGFVGDNSPSNLYSTVYYYDSYEWSRYFRDNLLWAYEFGDVNYYLDTPAITKTRPIESKAKSKADSVKESSKDFGGESIAEGEGESNQNSILLQLEKNRHFCFFKDKIPYADKKDALVFRGACFQEHRNKFLREFFHHPKCDIGDTSGSAQNAEFAKPKISKEAHLEYKFILSLEGNDVASNLKWVMNSNSLCIMPKPKYESWFMESKLVSGVHYAEINDEYSDIESVIEHYLSHENQAQEIITNAQKYCAKFQNPRIEEACNLLVLRKYFALSGQIDITREECELFGI